ncbi:MAG: DUF362 domain-containing protein [Calditrichaeota bacterium]|nr:MAG: DUF362 domain-containing protein [Calditrichota bacterium]
MKNMTRRHMLKYGAVGAAAFLTIPVQTISNISSARPSVAVAKNGSPEQLVNTVFELLGGIERYVSPGQSVLIKPNIGWDRVPEQAANTNPDVVAQVVRLCRDAGASVIRVLDRTCNHPQRCYKQSQIESSAKAAGAQVRHLLDDRFHLVRIPQGKVLKEWTFYCDALEFDVFINIPVAKTHSVSGLTLGMKNLMGIIGGDRGLIHTQFEHKIVDLNTVIRPTLTLIDGYRILIANGPSGGSIADVKLTKTLIASADIVAADAVAAELLFDVKAQDLLYLRNAFDRGLGQMFSDQMMIKNQDLANGHDDTKS